MRSLVFITLFALQSLGAYGSVVKNRVDWFYNGGYFHKISGSRSWSETINGVETFQFVENARTDQYVELFDYSRLLSVRLFADSVHLKGVQDHGFHYFKPGHWDDRRLYSFYDNGKVAYFLLQPHAIWRLNKPDGSTVYLREISRTDSYVILFNARDNYSYGLGNGNLIYQSGSGPWETVSSGKWN